MSDDVKKRTIACGEHGEDEAWVICVHATKENSKPQLLVGEAVTGEVLCPSCKDDMAAGGVDSVIHHLRGACGKCVRKNWDVQITTFVQPS
jgi:hypothetical protein